MLLVFALLLGLIVVGVLVTVQILAWREKRRLFKPPTISVSVDGDKIRIEFSKATVPQLTVCMEELLYGYVKHVEEEQCMDPRSLIHALCIKVSGRLKGHANRLERLYEVSPN